MHQPPIPQIDAEDPEIAGLIHDEARRQQDKFRLIASENYVSAAVLEASGTLLTNKYSEGYPGKRYYEGQQFIDPIESIAVARAQALFGVEHANVQPYSGSPANLAAYLAFASPGDTVMGLALAMGGHLTHGAGVTIGGKWFNSVQYGVRRDTGRIDFDEVRDLALRERPKVIFCGGTALPRTVDFPAFAEIAAEVDAVLVADIAHIAGLVAGGAHPSPVGFAPVITTTTHKTLRGPRGAMIMTDAAHATAVDKAVFPGLQGGPHNHTTAAIAVALHEAAQPSFRRYAAQVVANAAALGVGAAGPGLRPGVRRHRQPPAAGGPHLEGDRRQAGREGARQGRHRAELQRGPVRHPPPVRPVRHPPRHPRDHHQGPHRGAHAAAGGVDGRGHHGRRQGRRGAPRPHRGRDQRPPVRLPHPRLDRRLATGPVSRCAPPARRPPAR